MPSETDLPAYGDIWSFGTFFPLMFVWGRHRGGLYETYWMVLDPKSSQVGKVSFMTSWKPDGGSPNPTVHWSQWNRCS